MNRACLKWCDVSKNEYHSPPLQKNNKFHEGETHPKYTVKRCAGTQVPEYYSRQGEIFYERIERRSQYRRYIKQLRYFFQCYQQQ